MTSWTTLARERADFLEDQISDLRTAGVAQDKLDTLSGKLAGVRVRHIDVHGHLAWLTGHAINESWSELHRIEERIDDLTPDMEVGELVEVAERHVKEELPARRAAELKPRLASAVTAADRRKLAVAAIQEAHAAAEARHESERNQQRGILYITAGFLAAAVITLVVQAVMPAGDRIIPLPSSGGSLSGTAMLALVMLFGMLGGGLSALISLYTTSKVPATLWFDLRPALSMVKVVVGLWTAVFGVLAVGSGVVVGVYTTLASALLLAFIFGYGQQAVTTFIDRKVVDIVAKKP